jgi:hypothetical protein
MAWKSQPGRSAELSRAGSINFCQDSAKVVYFEYLVDLCEESGQQREVAAAHPDQPCDDLRGERLVWERNVERRPALLGTAS